MAGRDVVVVVVVRLVVLVLCLFGMLFCLLQADALDDRREDPLVALPRPAGPDLRQQPVDA